MIIPAPKHSLLGSIGVAPNQDIIASTGAKSPSYRPLAGRAVLAVNVPGDAEVGADRLVAPVLRRHRPQVGVVEIGLLKLLVGPSRKHAVAGVDVKVVQQQGTAHRNVAVHLLGYGNADAGYADLDFLQLGEDPLYARITAYIDQETCVPLRIEFYKAADKLLKILEADPAKIQRTGNIRMAHAMTIQDLKQKVVTALRVEKAEIDKDLPDSIFSPNQLQRNHCRRLQSSAWSLESLER